MDPLTRPNVRCPLNSRRSLGNPTDRSSASIFFCSARNPAVCPVIPTHTTRGRRICGNTPTPAASSDSGPEVLTAFETASQTVSTASDAIFPRNFKVRWIFSGRTHRMLKPYSFKRLWISAIEATTRCGSSMATKVLMVSGMETSVQQAISVFPKPFLL